MQTPAEWVEGRWRSIYLTWASQSGPESARCWMPWIDHNKVCGPCKFKDLKGQSRTTFSFYESCWLRSVFLKIKARSSLYLGQLISLLKGVRLLPTTMVSKHIRYSNGEQWWQLYLGRAGFVALTLAYSSLKLSNFFHGSASQAHLVRFMQTQT